MTRKIKFKHIYFVYLDSISLELIYLKQNPPVVQGDTGIQFSVSPWELGRIGDTSGLGRSVREERESFAWGVQLVFSPCKKTLWSCCADLLFLGTQTKKMPFYPYVFTRERETCPAKTDLFLKWTSEQNLGTYLDKQIRNFVSILYSACRNYDTKIPFLNTGLLESDKEGFICVLI